MATVLDEYHIVTDVPKPGGMGLVYRARRASGEVIALKVIPLGHSGDSEAIARSERRGAEVQKLLGEKDRHVPRVYEFGEKHGVFFIEMEFVDGEDLSTILARRGTIEPREAARIAYEVASFLEVAHETTYGDDHKMPAALVHSDLKPSNIRIAGGSHDIKILDFGIAKAGWHTVTTKHFGSLPYMSPECIEGHIDRHADYWALGVALYEMVAGRLPFSVAEGPSQLPRLQQLIVSGCPPQPLPPTVPLGLQAIVTKMLRSDQTRRYQDAAQIKADLAAFLDGATPLALLEFRQPHEGDTIVVQPVRAKEAAPGAPTIVVKPTRSVPEWRSRVPSLTLRICVIAMLCLAADAYAVRQASYGLATELRDASSLDPDTGWARYQRIRRWAVTPFLMRDAQFALKERLVGAADRVLADFRRDQPTVRATSWRAARAWLEKAVALDDSDLRARALLRCAEAHLLRIDAEGRRPNAHRTVLLQRAALRFDDAAGLDPDLPDPYLGLARIYSFGLVDFERTLKALEAGEERGHAIGRRGHAQLGDAMKVRADRLRQAAEGVRGLPEEREYLGSAWEDYLRALAYYDNARGFGFVADNVRLIRRRLEQIDRRLADIEEFQ
jgi:serine/threonine protein kinase